MPYDQWSEQGKERPRGGPVSAIVALPLGVITLAVLAGIVHMLGKIFLSFVAPHSDAPPILIGSMAILSTMVVIAVSIYIGQIVAERVNLRGDE